MSGFSAAATRFFADLEEDNSREFGQAHADVYDREVKQPMLDLLESRPARYQPFRQGAISKAGGSGYYLHLDGRPSTSRTSAHRRSSPRARRDEPPR